MATYDVAVIGAGVHGAAAAYHLARKGASTVVFERWSPAGGPTGRSSAVCRSYYTNPFLATCARDSIEMMANFEALTGMDCGYRRTGVLFLHPTEEEEQVQDAASKLNGLGIETEVLSPREVLDRFPFFDLGGVGLAAWQPEGGYADPAATTVGLFRKGVALGARARLGTTVEAIEPEGDGWLLQESDGERASAAKVLIAAGPWTRPLALTAGVDLPLHVERHIVGTFRWAGAEPAPLHADVPNGYYFRPEGTELFLMGPMHEAPEADPDDYPEWVTEDELRSLSSAVTRRIPSLERAEVHGGWASLYDVSPDWQPVIGEIAPGLFVDAGTSGHGFKLAPALGGHVADLVLGESWDPGLDQFHPRRFEEGAGLDAGFGEARILG